jgi:hypothetical protein
MSIRGLKRVSGKGRQRARRWHQPAGRRDFTRAFRCCWILSRTDCTWDCTAIVDTCDACVAVRAAFPNDALYARRPTQSLNAWNCAPVHPAMLQRFVAGLYVPPFCTAQRHGMLVQPRAKATELVPINDTLMAAARMKPFQNMVAPLSLDVGLPSAYLDRPRGRRGRRGPSRSP